MTTRQVGMTMRLLSLCTLTTFPAVAFGDDLKDDAKKDANSVKRSVNKGANRVDEAACTGSAAECDAKKGKHRIGETKEKVVDKMNEASGK